MLLRNSLALVGVLAPCSAWCEQESGALTPHPPEVRFGHVWASEPLREEVELRNDGSHLVDINKVASSCGCTRVRLSSHRLAPGGAAVLEVTADLSEDPHEAYSGFVFVQWNKDHVLQIPVKAAIRPEMTVTPARVDFGQVRAARGAIALVRIQEKRTGSWELTGVRIPQPLAGTWRRVKPAKGLEVYELVLALPPGTPPQRFRGHIIIETDLTRRPEWRIPVSAQVVPVSYKVEPDVLVFKADQLNQAVSGLTLICEGQAELVSVETGERALAAHITGESQPGRQRVDLVLTNWPNKPQLTGRLRLTLRDGPFVQVVEVPYFGAVTGGKRP